jgi:hypothetical protein
MLNCDPPLTASKKALESIKATFYAKEDQK